MIPSRISKMINLQINREFYSAYFYFDMATYYSIQGLAGFSHWFTYQAQEEMEHAVKFRDYLLACNVNVELEPILAPPKGYANLEEPLQLTLQHEKQVTAWVKEIHVAATEEKDFRTLQLIDWFVKEQEEEEENTSALLASFIECHGNAEKISMLDASLSKRGLITTAE